MKNGIQTLAIAAALVSAAATADTTISFTSVDDDGSDTGTTEIASGKVRMSGADGEGHMIFDASEGSFTAINHSDRSYIVFDKEQVEKLARMQEQVMAQMEAQLAQLPPAQRAQMKKMMGSMMPQMPEAPPPRRYERTGEEKTVSGYDCEILVVYAGDRRVSEQCVTERDELDIPDADYDTFRAMQAFMQELVNSFARMSDQVVDFGEPGRDEIPVEFIHYSKLAGESRGYLKAISHDPIDPSRFEVPAGYKAQQIPDMPQF